MGSPGTPEPCGPCAASSPFVVTPTSWHAYAAGASYGSPVRRPCYHETGSGDLLPLLRDIQMDHAIGPTTSTVDDTGLVGVLVMEEVEVVSDQLHLVERLVQPHRHGRVNLLTYMNRRISVRAKDSGTRRPRCTRRRSWSRLRRSSNLSIAMSRAPYLSSAMASARTTGPLTWQVISTRSHDLDWRLLTSWVTTTSRR